MSEKISDNASLTSTSISRASSPPPSKVGTAPVRHVSKSQQKKERQARAKQAEEIAKSESVPEKSIPEEPEQAPIIGRKKKTKKARSTADSTPTATRPTSPEPTVTEEVIEEQPESVPASPTKTPREDTKISTPKRETAREPESPATPDVQPSSTDQAKTNLSAAFMISTLQKSGEVSSSVQDLFKGVPGLNYRIDTSPMSYPDLPEVPPLTDTQRRELDDGGAIVVDVTANSRVVVLPNRSTIEGLSKDQANRYVALLKNLQQTPEMITFKSSKQQMRRPFHARASSLCSKEELGNRFVSAPTVEEKQPRPVEVGWPDMWSSSAWEDSKPEAQRPILPVEDAEVAMSASRKETEALEKKLNAVLRRNRRMGFGAH